MNEPLSASRISLYLQCPLKWFFRYRSGIQPEFVPAALGLGRAVHAACETFNKGRARGVTMPADEVAALFRSDWAAELVDNLRFKLGEDAGQLGELGEALVRAYVDANADLRVVEAEVAFEVPLVEPTTGEVLHGLTLRGFFDAVLDSDVVLEIKTSARAFDQGTLARRIQFSAYAFAYRQLHQRDPIIRVEALLKGRRPRVERYNVARTVEDDAWFVFLAREVARAINADVFPPNPSWACDDCEFQQPCRAWRGHADVVGVAVTP